MNMQKLIEETQALEKILDDVNNARSQWITDHTDSYQVYKYLLGSLLRATAKPSATYEAKKRMAELLPEFVKFKLHSESLISMRASKRCALLLSDPTLLQHCLEQDDGAKTVAWLCVHRAYDCGTYDKRDTKGLLNVVLQNWLGKSLNQPQNPSLHEVVGIIYGGHADVAELLGLNFDRNLVNRLWRENTPMLGLVKSPVSAIELPDELGLNL